MPHRLVVAAISLIGFNSGLLHLSVFVISVIFCALNAAAASRCQLTQYRLEVTRTVKSSDRGDANAQWHPDPFYQLPSDAEDTH